MNPSDNKFKFGVGKILKSLYVIEIPILLADEQITIKFDVVDSDIPLLLGKNTIKQWNLTINTRNDTAFFLLGFTPCKAEEPLQGMELQEKEAQKRLQHIGNLFRKNL